MVTKERALFIIEKELQNYNFRVFSFGGRSIWCHEKCFCIITFLECYSAFVIESTESRDEAEKGVFEDGELFFISRLSEEELIQKLKVELDFLT